MLLVVVDGNGNQQTLCVQGQGAATDFSGSIAVDATSQPVAAANPNRSGLYFQNTSADPLTVSELGDATLPNAFLIPPGASWPPQGYDVPITEITVAGLAGDTFVYREW